MRITAVIVDDEQPICDEIEYLLEQHIDIEVVAKFTHCAQALSYILEKKPDVVFLDIKMPGMSGLELAQKLNVLRYPPLVVFVTAFEEHAVYAFETPAVGYVTKPITEDKMAKVANKIRTLLGKYVANSAIQPAKVCVLANQKIVPISKREIVFVFVKNKDVYVRTRTGEYSSPLKLQEFDRLLAENNFLRVHRQYIINLDEILEIAPWFHGAYLLRMNDFKKQEITVSRNKVKLLKSVLGLK
jgi:two-component system LytT family response regulator/two-component system response regulator LytT